MKKSNNSSGAKPASVLGAVAAVPVSFLMVVSLGLIEGLLIVSALNENFTIPAIGPVSEDLLARLLDSRLILALGVALAAIPLLLLVLCSLHRLRRAFLTAGVSALISAALSIGAGIMGARAVRVFPAQWQGILVSSSAVWGRFSMVCGFILIAAGAGSLSVYASIVAVKGDRHEKDT